MELTECINYLLTTAQHTVFQKMSLALAEFDITPGQYGVLNVLWKQGATAPKEIAHILCLETTTVSGVLDRMQKKGLIDRVLDDSDRRSVKVLATDKGKALEEPVLAAVEQVNQDVLSIFSEEEAQQLKAWLRAIS